jgi:lysophospholipase L1-like esterase
MAGIEHGGTPRRLRIAVAIALAIVVGLAAPAVAAAAKGSKDKKSDEQFYVALGDSYAIGYQPPPGGGIGSSTKDGYAYKLPKLARKRGYDLELVNFGCGDTETTTSILERTAQCISPAIGGPDYTGRTQADAAASFLRHHRGDVRLVTVSIGGNDVTACANAPDPFGCVTDAVQKIRTNLATLVQRLRAAAGKRVKIVGLTYPDVILGLWVTGSENDRNLASASVAAFRDLINPALKEQYESVKGVFVDVTAATDAYFPLDQTTQFPPYGELPIAVATVCRISYYCELRDIHLKPDGYFEMAELIAETLPKKK